MGVQSCLLLLVVTCSLLSGSGQIWVQPFRSYNSNTYTCIYINIYVICYNIYIYIYILTDQCATNAELWKREVYWQHRLKTFYPNGLNEREESCL